MDWSEKEELTQEEQKGLLQLWNKEYPTVVGHPSLDSLSDYLKNLEAPRHKLIKMEGQLMVWFSTFNREGARWFAMIIDERLQGQGLGSQLLSLAKQEHDELLGWATDHDRYTRADGKPYPSPIAFYQKNDFEVLKGQRVEKGQLSAAKIRWRKSDL